MSASKFNVTISGGSGHIFMGDGTNVDIKDGDGKRGRNQRPTINLRPVDPAFTVQSRVPVTPAHGQESQRENSVCYEITQGYALVIHNCYFPEGILPDRHGSERDLEAIKDFCLHAGIRVNNTDRETENLTATQIDNLCNEISKRSFSSYDAFLCFILSHGNEDGIYGVDDNTISVQQIVTKFKDCEGLAGKPKLFFIQACRGSNKDSGIMTDSHPVSPPIPRLRLPTDADILIAHSTVEGNESYRDPVSGSWFMYTLTEALRKHAHEMHVMDILTLVNNEMAGYKTPKGLKQMPCQMTTLTKFVYFNYPPPLSS